MQKNWIRREFHSTKVVSFKLFLFNFVFELNIFIADFSLTVENGTFSWGEETNILKNINVKVMKKKLIALVGPVGCGKYVHS